jgi:hypothetical protein
MCICAWLLTMLSGIDSMWLKEDSSSEEELVLDAFSD